jgi:hypothetical protein
MARSERRSCPSPPHESPKMTIEPRPVRNARNAARYRRLGLAAALLLCVAPLAASAQSTSRVPWKDRFGDPLPFQSDEEIIEFLQTAEIQSVEDLEVGITDPRRVELVKDGITVRAALRDFDHTYERMRFEREFYQELRDSYLFDIAAYELSGMLGLNNIPPVTLRRVNGVEASLQIWLEDALVEWDRYEQQIPPPDRISFQKQYHNMLVFDSVIGNVDRNNGNILYDANWNHWLIDHSRAFVPGTDKMPYLDRILGCSRGLYLRLKELDREELMERLSPPLDHFDVDWILQRRDKVIAHLDALIAQHGEDAILFDGYR